MKPNQLNPQHIGQPVRVLGVEGGLSDYQHHFEADHPGHIRKWTHTTVYLRGTSYRLSGNDTITVVGKAEWRNT